MQTLGNPDFLRKEIKKTYENRFQEFAKEKSKEFEDEKKEIEEKHIEGMKKAKAELNNEEKKVFRTTSAEEKLNAKKEFENKRESLINEVFEKAEKKADDILAGKDYLTRVKESLKGIEATEIAGNLESYKKEFPDMKIDRKIRGIIARDVKNIFDFTYDAFIVSGKLDLRHKVSHILFKDDN